MLIVYTCMDSPSFLHLKITECEKAGKTQGVKIKGFLCRVKEIVTTAWATSSGGAWSEDDF